jgi:outer membrane protein W
MLRLVRAGVNICISCVLGALVVGLIATPAASAQQSFNFYIGGFTPRSETARTPDDVLVNNLDFLVFNIKDFNAPTFGGEYLVGMVDKFEAGLGIGYQSKSVPTVYAIFVNANGTEIEQEIKLRVVPVTATIRFLPLGHNNGVTPYIGAGVGVFGWRYSETGEFLATDSTIFRGNFVGSGTATGPVILGGVRVPIGNWGIGGELRYQSAKGDLPADQDFAYTVNGVGPRIDLGGFTGMFTVNVRF